MRSRIALIAAIAAVIVMSTAAVASAVALTGSSLSRGAAHALRRERKGAAALRHHGALHSPRFLHQLVGEFEWKALRRHHVVTRTQPVTAGAAPAATPTTAPVPTAAPPAPAPAPQPPVVEARAFTNATSTTTPDWVCIRDHESGDNYSENTGNGYSGAYQFLPSTWNEAVSAAGFPQYANGWAFEAPPAVQNAAALWLYNRDGWQPWSTRYVCGL